jgi:hypothetical protein
LVIDNHAGGPVHWASTSVARPLRASADQCRGQHGAPIAPHLQRQATDAFNHEINGFVNRVRHHMSVEDIEFEFIDEKVMQKVLELGD